MSNFSENDFEKVKNDLKNSIENLGREIDDIHSRMSWGMEDSGDKVRELERIRLEEIALLMLIEKFDELEEQNRKMCGETGATSAISYPIVAGESIEVSPPGITIDNSNLPNGDEYIRWLGEQKIPDSFAGSPWDWEKLQGIIDGASSEWKVCEVGDNVVEMMDRMIADSVWGKGDKKVTEEIADMWPKLGTT